MRRHVGGAGRGARGRGMNAPPKHPGGAGAPPGALRPPRGASLTEGGWAGLAKAIHAMAKIRKRGPALKNAAMERRKAPVSFKRGRGKTNTDALYRRSIPSFMRGAK